MVENGATLVEQIIDAELDPRLDSPPERSVVVICHVIYDERIIGSQPKWWFGVRTAWVRVACLEREPDLLKRHPLGLAQFR